MQINRAPVSTAEDAAGFLQRLGGRAVVMYVERAGRLVATQFVIGGR